MTKKFNFSEEKTQRFLVTSAGGLFIFLATLMSKIVKKHDLFVLGIAGQSGAMPG